MRGPSMVCRSPISAAHGRSTAGIPLQACWQLLDTILALRGLLHGSCIWQLLWAWQAGDVLAQMR